MARSKQRSRSAAKRHVWEGKQISVTPTKEVRVNEKSVVLARDPWVNERLVSLAPDWRRLAAPPAKRIQPGVHMGDDGNLYLLGGMNRRGRDAGLVDRYDPRADAWTRLPKLPKYQAGTSATIGADGRIYVLTADTGLAHVLTPTGWRWEALPPLPTPRIRPAICVGPDGRLYVMGGMTLENEMYLDLVEVYSPESRAWSKAAPMPDCRASMLAIAATNGRIYVLGGKNDETAYLDEFGEPVARPLFQAYVPEKDQWIHLPDARWDAEETGAMTIACRDNAILVASMASDYRHPENDELVCLLDSYSLATNTWGQTTAIRGFTAHIPRNLGLLSPNMIAPVALDHDHLYVMSMETQEISLKLPLELSSKLGCRAMLLMWLLPLPVPLATPTLLEACSLDDILP